LDFDLHLSKIRGRRLSAYVDQVSQAQGETNIADLLEGSKCVIQDSTTFSGKRWDAFYTKIYFYVPLSNLEKVNQVIVDKLIAFCDSIMPGDAGLDVMDVEFSPLLESAETMDRSLAQVEDAAASLSVFFPDLNWIAAKIDELSDCRNLVANSSATEFPSTTAS
jgi:hypothetical protein